jgi:hypothetical protein
MGVVSLLRAVPGGCNRSLLKLGTRRSREVAIGYAIVANSAAKKSRMWDLNAGT